MRDGSEGEFEESCSIIPFDTSLICCIALRTVVQFCVCPQSSSLSTGHMRKHIDITHASAWLKVTLKRDICFSRVRSTLLNVCQSECEIFETFRSNDMSFLVTDRSRWDKYK